MRPPGFLFVVISCLCLHLQATENDAITDSDPRFRLLQPADTGSKPPDGPPGVAVGELTFWQHRIGSDDTPALLIATSTDGQVWINAQRDDKWIAVPKVEQSDTHQWTSTIKSQVAASRTLLWPTPESIPIRLKKEPSTGLWMIASLIQLEGQLDLNGRATKYRLRDENSDGKLEGIDDTLQIDLNGNGQFDKLRESFPLTKFFRHQGGRYAIQLDRKSRTVGVQAFDASGTAQLTFDGWEQLEQPPTRIHVALQSDAGFQAVFTDTQPQALPPGLYHVYSAVLNWDGDEKWRMTFARWDSKPKQTIRVEANTTTKISVLGRAELMAEVEAYTFSDNAWQVTIQPVLKTETGLYLTRSSSGSLSPSVDGTLVAAVQSASNERTLTTGSTQFACGTFCPIMMKWKDETASQIKLSFDTGPLASVVTSIVKLEKK